ncbi:hypothetical protein ACFLZX_02865 [Nanoarchaeota archaeon]
MDPKPSNIRESVWKIIDTDLALKKDISRGLINIRGLANYIKNEHKLNVTLDGIISAIRRYQTLPSKKAEPSKVYSVLKQAKIRSITKIASLSLKKNEDVHQKIGEILPKTNFTAGEILRVLEGSKLFKIIFDQKDFNSMVDIFGKKNIVASNKKLGMIEILYPDILEKTPGVFIVISNEFANHDISIRDALICSNEHVIIVDEDNLLKALEIVFNICQTNSTSTSN